MAAVRKVAILQSNYIPWKGYFDLTAAVDELILYDDVQYTKNDWRNRNRIKTPNGVAWLTIPVGATIGRTVREVRLPDSRWRDLHWRTLVHNYRRARHFAEVAPMLEPLYRSDRFDTLSGFNRALIETVCVYLSIRTRLSDVRDYRPEGDRIQRLVSLCLQAGAAEYVTGPSAAAYLDASIFHDNGLAVTWFDYAGYPPYPQLWGGFEHHVTVLDLLFNCGPEAPDYMKHVRS